MAEDWDKLSPNEKYLYNAEAKARKAARFLEKYHEMTGSKRKAEEAPEFEEGPSKITPAKIDQFKQPEYIDLTDS